MIVFISSSFETKVLVCAAHVARSPNHTIASGSGSFPFPNDMPTKYMVAIPY
jgi:hypothetical protein